jgi:hypothetical protein
MEEKEMKKITTSIIAFAIAMVLAWGAPNVTAQAADNSSSASAQAISLNTSVTDSLVDRSDVNWYKFEIKDAGYFEAKLGPSSLANADNISMGWDLYIYDSSYTKIQYKGGITSSYTGAKLAFEKGTYYVKVAGSSYGAPVDCKYDLQVAFTSATDWESEYNNESGKADTITENDMVRGSLYTADDVDWYKISITTTGYFTINFAPDSSTNADDISFGWDLYVYDSSYNEIQ